MKCLTSKANCLAYLTQHKHILTWQRGELGYSLQYAEPVTALHKNSGIYLANIPSLWKTLLWFPTSQHVSHSALAVTLTTTHKFKMCSLSKCRLFSRRVAQKWGKAWNSEVLWHAASHLTRWPWIQSPRLSTVESGIWQRRLSLSSVSITSRTLLSSSRRWRALRLPMKGEVGDWQSNMPLE